MKKVLMTIGLPFPGKSTLADIYKEKGWSVVERDKILRDILDSEEFEKQVRKKCVDSDCAGDKEVMFVVKNEIAIKMLNEKLVSEFGKIDGDIFYDGTNLQEKGRRGLLDLMGENYSCEALYLNIPLDELRKRAEKAREERVGKFNEGAYYNLDRMNSMLDKPKEGEGFSKITEFTKGVRESEFFAEHKKWNQGRL